MKNVRTKVGDVFTVPIDEHSKKYFQYVANDITQLNSDVIRAFKKTYALDDNPDSGTVVSSEVDFYAHVVIKWGIKMNLWDKVGHAADVGHLDVLFRNTNDCGRKLGEEPVKVSLNWHVWKVNEDFRSVGRLTGDNRNSEIGVVVSPVDIVDRMRTGKYHFVYPDFE